MPNALLIFRSGSKSGD